MLKAYISGALMGASSLTRVRELYERFAEACISEGWEPYLPHSRTDPEQDRDLHQLTVADTDLEQLRSADAMIVYLGEPSLGTGAEVVLAMQAEKPILALYESGKQVSRFVGGLLQKYPRVNVFPFPEVPEATCWIRGQLRQIESGGRGNKQGEKRMATHA